MKTADKSASAPLKTLSRGSEGFLAAVKRILLENPVLINGLSLGPAVAICQSLKAGVSLSLAFAIIIIPVFMIFGLITAKLSKSVRIILGCLLSAEFFIPAFWVAQTVFSEVSDKVGVFLPLMVVNPIISARSFEAVKGKYSTKIIFNAVETSAGFAVVMCFVSAIREIFGKGTIWEKPILGIEGNISFLLPFMGFIIVGFFAAGVRYIAGISSKKHRKGENK